MFNLATHKPLTFTLASSPHPGTNPTRSWASRQWPPRICSTNMGRGTQTGASVAKSVQAPSAARRMSASFRGQTEPPPHPQAKLTFVI